jgi:hypothetical protein
MPMKSHHFVTTAVAASLLASSAIGQATFADDFNRADTQLNTDAAISIGADYELVQLDESQSAPTVGIRSNRVTMGQLSANAIAPALIYKGLTLPDTSVGGSFTVSGNITTQNFAVDTHLYGLIFNRQDDGSFYAARINTAHSSTTVLQFIKISQGRLPEQSVASIVNSQPLAPNATYRLTVSSAAPGEFSYELTGENLDDGGTLSGNVNDTTLPLIGGYGGFYNNYGNSGSSFDDLSITVVSEP